MFFWIPIWDILYKNYIFDILSNVFYDKTNESRDKSKYNEI